MPLRKMVIAIHFFVTILRIVFFFSEKMLIDKLTNGFNGIRVLCNRIGNTQLQSKGQKTF